VPAGEAALTSLCLSGGGMWEACIGCVRALRPICAYLGKDRVHGFMKDKGAIAHYLPERWEDVARSEGALRRSPKIKTVRICRT